MRTWIDKPEFSTYVDGVLVLGQVVPVEGDRPSWKAYHGNTAGHSAFLIGDFASLNEAKKIVEDRLSA